MNITLRESITSQIAAVTTLSVAWLVTPMPVFAQTYQTIDPPDSTYTFAGHINSNGQIVGFYQDSNHTEHGFLDKVFSTTTASTRPSILPIASKLSLITSIHGEKSSGTTLSVTDPNKALSITAAPTRLLIPRPAAETAQQALIMLDKLSEFTKTITASTTASCTMRAPIPCSIFPALVIPMPGPSIMLAK
jgi:hypothetical protein